MKPGRDIMRTPSAVAIIVALGLLSAGAAVAGGQHAAPPSYEEFIALDSRARAERLSLMSPATIVALRRTHAERWFAAHRGRLSPAQVAVFVDALEFITVDVYKQPRDPEATKREELLRHRLTCVLGVENTRQAFVLHLPPDPVRAGWRSTVDAWLSWFFDCVAL